jgi:hypothetical protein
VHLFLFWVNEELAIRPERGTYTAIMNISIPDFVTHYYLADRKPFLSISELWGEELEKVLADLRAKNERGESKRWIAPWYVEERKKTEDFLRTEFLKKGGKVERHYPLYFLLGASEGLRNQSEQLEVRLQLKDLPKDMISFTYPDSMATFVLKDDPSYYKPYNGKVFTYREIIEVVKEHGFPKDELMTCSKFRYPNCIEMQLWSDAPVKAYR